MIRHAQVLRTLSILLTLAAATMSSAAPLVDADFEPPVTVVGNLNGQASTGPNPWTSLFGVVNNAGFFQDTQSAQYGNNMPPNALHDHSYVDLGPVVIPAGKKLKATVDIYMDPNEPLMLTGLVAYANGHSNQLGYFGGRGDGYKVGLDGTNNTTNLLGYFTNPVDAGWRNIGLEIEQVSPTTLVTTYLFEGQVFKHNGFNTTTHTDIAGGPSFVSDVALFSMNMGSTTEVGHGYYDNYRVAIVPEPATAPCCAVGCGRWLRATSADAPGSLTRPAARTVCERGASRKILAPRPSLLGPGPRVFPQSLVANHQSPPTRPRRSARPGLTAADPATFAQLAENLRKTALLQGVEFCAVEQRTGVQASHNPFRACRRANLSPGACV